MEQANAGGAATRLSRRGIMRGAALLGAGALLPGWLPARALAASGSAVEAGWPKVTALIERYVAERKLPGALAAFGWGDGPLDHIVRGHEGFDDADAVGLDSLFRVYSMTKPITGLAAMLLIDEGKLALDQPLADILPEFAAMRVAIDPAKSLESRPAASPITIRHMLTHTAGFGYAGIGQDAVSRELLRLGVTPAVVSRMVIPGLTPEVPTPAPAEFLRRAASVPLLVEPGRAWRYSMSLDILGLAIQRAAGAASFGAFLQERLFDPLGMTSSYFRVPESETGRFATSYGMLAGVPLPLDPPRTSAYLDEAPFAFGGAGLVTSPADYDRFLRVLVGRGSIDGRRVMSERAVAMGLSNLLPAGADTRGTFAEGAGFGAGGRVGLGADEGSFGWSGAAGTVGFVNTRIGLRAGLYLQMLPAGVLPIQREFLEAARADALGRMTG